MSNRDLSKSFKNFCPRCKYFQQETGVCKKYFINSRDYPIEFLNNCAGDYFKEAPQISEQTDVSDALEESKAFKGDGSRVSEMHLKEEMFYNPIFRELPRPERVFLVLYIISLPFIFLFTFLFFLAIVGGDFFDSQGTLITYRILAILLLSIWIYGLWWKFIRHPGKISNRYKNLLNQLKSNNVQTRREAAQKLGQLYPSLVSKLYILAMLGLNEEHNTLRRDAANSLGSFSNDAIVEALNNVSSNDDVEVSEAAKNAITCIKIQAQNELMPLIFPEFIENRREKLQDLIIASFNKLIRSTSNSKEGQEFISNILVPLLSHEDFFDKHFFNFKKCIKGVHNFPVKPLVEIIKKKMDREILQLLKYQSDLENKEANVTLVDLIQSKDEDFQYQVANKLRGLQWIPEEEKVKVLFNILTCNWEEVSKMGKAAYDQLVTALHHKNQDVRNNAMKALGVIGDKKALIPLIDLLMEPTIGIKKKACETILKIEPDWKKSPLLRDPLNKYFKEEEKRKMAQKEAEREKRAERRAEREKRMENLWPKINKVPNLNKIFKLYDCYATIKSTELKQKLDELRIEEPDTVSRFYRDYQGPNVKEGNLELTLGALINCIVDDMQPFNREFRVDIRKTLGVDSEFDNWSFEWISVKTITGDVHVISRFGKDIYAMFVHDNKTF